jgi:hypothetical protein
MCTDELIEHEHIDINTINIKIVQFSNKAVRSQVGEQTCQTHSLIKFSG